MRVGQSGMGGPNLPTRAPANRGGNEDGSMTVTSRRILRTAAMTVALGAVAACSGNQLDWDLRRADGMLRTTEAAQSATVNRPRPDARGVISYPNYQVAVARRGDSVATVADRLGLSAVELARYNALNPDDALRPGEVLALPGRVGETGSALAGTGAGSGAGAGSIDITTLATGAIDRAEGGTPPPAGTAAPTVDGAEPIRHQVVRGETAYSISRLYGVSPRALADWNGLGADLGVREGQFLMIPVTRREAALAATALATAPGTGSPTPTPPSAARPLPADNPPAAAAPAPATPPSPDLGAGRSSTARLAMPVTGPVIREYEKGRNDGIDIGAAAGSEVRAAAAGTVAAITRDTDQVTIVVLRHADNLLTVYANIDALTVAKDARVSRGQKIGEVRAGDPAFLHFEVRDGFESVDPMPFLQ